MERDFGNVPTSGVKRGNCSTWTDLPECLRKNSEICLSCRACIQFFRLAYFYKCLGLHFYTKTANAFVLGLLTKRFNLANKFELPKGLKQNFQFFENSFFEKQELAEVSNFKMCSVWV